jgi:lipopolysaccharide biosynthesis glycosyltransferase
MTCVALILCFLSACCCAASGVIDIGFMICNDNRSDPLRPASVYVRSAERQMRQVAVLLKSLALFNFGRSTIRSHVIADTRTFDDVVALRDVVASASDAPLYQFVHYAIDHVYSILERQHLKFLNRPCSSARLFLTQVHPNLDSILHLDTDLIFLIDVADVWRHFESFNATHVAGVSAMIFAEDPRFRRFPKPRHGELDDGINLGVSVIRLDRWRSAFPLWETLVHEWLGRYGHSYVFPTQDLFNTWLGLYPAMHYELPCDLNIRLTFAIRSYLHRFCITAVQAGAKIVHGAGGHFTDATPAFSQLFDAFEAFDPRAQQLHDLVADAERRMIKYPIATRQLFLARLSSLL